MRKIEICVYLLLEGIMPYQMKPSTNFCVNIDGVYVTAAYKKVEISGEAIFHCNRYLLF